MLRFFTTVLKSKISIILLAFLFLVIVYRLLICINYTPELSVGETNNMWNALNVAADRKPVYSNPENIPFEIFQYTPLSQLPVIAVAKYFDSEFDNYAYYVMVTARLFSLFYNLLTFYIIYLLMKNVLNVSKTLSIAAAATGFGLLTHLAFAIRPDSMSLCFIISSVYLFSKAYFQNVFFYFVYSGILLAFSFFVKQDAFTIIVALGFILLIDKKWKELIVFSSSFLLLFLILLELFNLIFGKFFLISIIGGISLGYSFIQMWGVFQHFLSYYYFIICLLIIAGFILLKSEKKFDKRHLFVIILCLVSFIVAVLTSFKLGSWMNYYSTFIIYAVIFIFYVVDFLIKKNNNRNIEIYFIYITTAYALFFIYLQIFHYTSPFLKYKQSRDKYSNTVEILKNLKVEVELHNYSIFTFDKQVKLLFFKNTIFPNTEFYHVSKFSFDGYNKLLPEQRIHYLIEERDLAGPQFSTLTYFHIPLSDFKLKNKLSNYYIYEYSR